MNNDKSVRNQNTQDIMKKIISSRENEYNDGVDTYAEDEIKEDESYEIAEARSTVEYMEQFSTRIIDQNPAKPKDYDKWTNEEQCEHIKNNLKTYMPSIPDSLIFFIPAVMCRGDCGRNSTDKPLWLDMEKFVRGQKFAQDHLAMVFLSNALSLFLLFAFEDVLKPLIFSNQSHTPYLGFKRYLSTAYRVKGWLTEDPLTVGTQAYKDIQTVRRMHRAIRKKLCERNNEEIETASKIQNPWCPDRETILEDFSSCPYPTLEKGFIHLLVTPKGLNQADMAATQFAFMGMVVLYSRKLGIYASDEDIEAFCHTWRCIGYLLGIEDQYNFCRGSLQEIKQRSRDFIDIWMKPYLRQVTSEWEHMLRCALENQIFFIKYNPFKTYLLFTTDLMNIDMPRIRKTLTYVEYFHLMFIRFIQRYVMRLRFVREYVNKFVCKELDKAVKFGPEKYEKLRMRSQQILNKARQHL